MKFGFWSLFLHTVAIFALFWTNFNQYPKIHPNTPIISIIPPKEFKKILLNKQVVRSQDGKTSIINPKKNALLSKTTNIVQKNMISPNTGSFINNKTNTSILTNGKGAPKTKGDGISASDDFIKGAVIGPMTILNTQEFKYFSYYDRIRQKVTETWRPLIKRAILEVKKDHVKHGELKIGLHTTKLLIQLDSDGNIMSQKVIESSNYTLFDQMAAKAFSNAAPFPGPPKDLVQNGVFSLRWDFIVEVRDSGLIEFRGGHVK
jgi:TonB family protein